MTRLRSLAHRLRHGHWRQPWAVYLGFEGHPADGCRACIKRAVMDDIADMARAMTRPPEQASRRQRIAGALFLLVLFVMAGVVPR